MRLSNFIYKIYTELKGTPSPIVPSYPREIDGGITNQCNLDCQMCPHNKITKKKGFMSFELFKSMVDTIREKCESKTVLGLGLWGEPLLHPNIKEFLQYATKEEVTTKIVSNCVNLTPDIAQAIIEAKIQLFEISFYTFNKEQYNKMVGREVFDIVLKNVYNFLALAEEKKFQGKLRLRPLASYAKEMDIYKKEFYEKYPSLNFERQTPKELSNWAGFLAPSKWWKNIYVYKPCTFCFTRLTIDWDGETYMCCQAMVAPDLSVGYINKDFDLYDMWNSDKFKNIRKKLLDLDYKSFPSCQKCNNARRYLR